MVVAGRFYKAALAFALLAGSVGFGVIGSARTPSARSDQAQPSTKTTPLSTAIARLDALPPEIRKQMLDPGRRFVNSPGLVWRSPTVTVAFEGGTPAMYALIEATANEWTSGHTRIHFSFRDSGGNWRQWGKGDPQPRAAIRISFDRSGYWSSVGITADTVDAWEPTMNFEGFANDLKPFVNGQQPEAWKHSYFHTVILHEFGHSLGLSHEQFHPDCQASLNMPAVIKYLVKRSGWEEDQARFNADGSYYQAQVEAADIRYKLTFSPHIDRASVMLYDLPVSLVGANSPCLVTDPAGFSTALSPGDRATFQSNYAPNT